MFRSLKFKFVLAFGSLILVLFATVGLFLVNAKESELSADISQRARSFAQLTTPLLAEAYELYMVPGDFLAFSRDVSAFLDKDSDVSRLSITSYPGVILYDSSQESLTRYSGVLRTLSDPVETQRVQAGKVSVLLSDGRLLYLKSTGDAVSYVDFNENPVAPLDALDRILNVTVPHGNAYAMTYWVSYETMEQRLASARLEIFVIAVVGFLLALGLSFMLSISITNPLKDLKNGALKIAMGDFSVNVPVRTQDEVGVLAGTFNQMAKDLSAALEVRLYKERVAHELELAAKIQSDLLPKTRVELDTLDLAGGLHPATEIGGDAFDFVATDSGDYLIYLGDVSGHGVPAGILSSLANGLIYSMRNEADLKTLALRLNAVIHKKSSSNMFMTMALTQWSPKTKQLSYLNAGHLPLLYYNSAQKKVLDIKTQGIALGMMEDPSALLHEEQIPLNPNDVVVLYSDGFPEAQNAHQEQYGMQRLRRIVQQAGDDLLTAEGIKNAVLSDVMQFIDTHEHLDDITVVVMRRKA